MLDPLKAVIRGCELLDLGLETHLSSLQEQCTLLSAGQSLHPSFQPCLLSCSHTGHWIFASNLHSTPSLVGCGAPLFDAFCS